MTTAIRAPHCAHSTRTVCAACAPPEPGHPARDPVRLAELLPALLRHAASPDPGPPPAGPSAVCRSCAAPASWHRTAAGRWIPLEPGAHLTESVPPGKRWRLGPDGTAHNLGRSSPADTCRITHLDVCPANPAPAHSPALLALWRRHASRAAGA